MVTAEQEVYWRKKYNPEGSELRTLQMCLLKMLVDFDRICKANGIRYWLSSGTCLGAVRHKGFIPWDDDVDVEMMEEDFRKLAALFKGDEDYFLQTPYSDGNYVLGFAKFRDRHSEVTENGDGGGTQYRERGLFIDIFTLGHNNFPSFVYQRIKQHSCWIGGLCRFASRSGLMNGAAAALKGAHFRLVESVRRADDRDRKDTLRYSAGNNFYKYVFHKRDFEELVDLEFEGHRFPVPKGYDGYLTDMFGDYMTPPDERAVEKSRHFLSFRLAR